MKPYASVQSSSLLLADELRLREGDNSTGNFSLPDLNELVLERDSDHPLLQFESRTVTVTQHTALHITPEFRPLMSYQVPHIPLVLVINDGYTISIN